VVGRLDQARGRFATDASVLEVFMAETGVVVPEARSSLAKLGIDAAKLARPSADLSPGERTRAVLAAFATRGVNVLVLDEPTNHLDLPAIEQLEAAVERFDGTVVVVSHDRAFLEQLRTTRTIAMEDGQVIDDRPT
jgi:ATPase subunit of ABC transporter with duplicated ATPase domains